MSSTANPTLPFSRQNQGQVTTATIRPQVTLPNAIINNRNSVVVSGNEAEREACRDIHCDYDATCELGPDNFPRCSCHFDCASAMGEGGGKPVCASDMRIYPSICVMKMEGCQRQEELRLRPLDLCEGVNRVHGLMHGPKHNVKVQLFYLYVSLNMENHHNTLFG